MNRRSAARRILVVEDEENLRLALQDNLEEEGHLVSAVGDGAAARELWSKHPYDLVVLDIALPDTDGYTLCREIRERGLAARVLMLTARTLEDDLVRGFQAGADDYVAKPYRLRELLARVDALLRRADVAQGPTAEELRLGDWVIDTRARQVRSFDGHELELTRTEFDLIVYLCLNADRALTRDQILDAVWGEGLAIDPRTVDNFVSRLKSRLAWTPESRFRIRTVRGVGYRLELE
ncbi:MAG: response regulator transcription factor [Myxococcota bacterium]|nr:response regulator transcription factor [Myxococcota bacterium]